MLIEKNNLPLVAMDFMNEVHQEDVEIINELFELILAYEKDESLENKKKLIKKYGIWIEHTLQHFQGEEEKMKALSFPPYNVHKDEHDKALETMNYVFMEWKAQGDIKILKTYFIEHLPTWLTQHIASMDMVTAEFFKTGLSPCSI